MLNMFVNEQTISVGYVKRLTKDITLVFQAKFL
uniref:Uncharacterized protein n=1 Tax=Siphoviridae sp. ctxMM9 TaxID=2827973 RepID=A0A8S5T6T5_9CAUD|nr:MAG TPA: hypothetical protein [Siphoviridae sp. ctxMM9]